MVSGLTERQSAVLEAIRQWIAEHGVPPTRQELSQHLGFRSANAAEEHLQALVRKGAISLRKGASRGIQILGATASQPSGLPLVGRVAAGQPILATQHIEDWLPLDPRMFRPTADYLLRVQGASMEGAGILSGDLLAVHATPEAANGQVVVARVEDEVTVKRFERHGTQVTLHAENPLFPPLSIDLRHQDFALEGQVVGVLRR